MVDLEVNSGVTKNVVVSAFVVDSGVAMRLCGWFCDGRLGNGDGVVGRRWTWRSEIQLLRSVIAR